MIGDPASMAKVSNATAPTCGIGYTYCGYILQQEKHFELGAILTAYCGGGDCDSATGTTRTDPLQALYMCLPKDAIPKKRDADDDKPYSGPVKIELLCACSGEPFDGEDNMETLTEMLAIVFKNNVKLACQ
ncbi:hypothetical protein UCDDA912_g09904 [Diaporthe ampelina]|uniref:Uncharacterized protein n=1 Tax=Diaporthe ampelina TaxID=1214573 RepID=A0A0G2F7I4_9PEZI|nr:hypothetical protein UCDDA912_g09904 [Diaporthe ampelina]